MRFSKGLIPMICLILISYPGSWGKPNMRSVWSFDGRREDEEVTTKEYQDEEMEIEATVEPDGSGDGLKEKVKKVANSCICPILLKPVCGSDGVTYPNKYCIKCNTTNTTVVIAHQGPCTQDDKQKAKFTISRSPYHADVNLPYPCYCPLVEDLVCDADGDTHYNIPCMKCIKPRMTISKKGPCDTEDTRYGLR